MDAPELLSERRHQQQNAVWELVHTEAAYLHTLKVITDVSSSNAALPAQVRAKKSCALVYWAHMKNLRIVWRSG